MKKIARIALASIGALVLASFMLIDKSAEAVQKSDTEFLQEAASSGQMEVQLGKLAQEKATNPRIKSYGAMMVRDHSAANADLMKAAKELNITISDNLMPKQRRHVEHLSGLSGTVFDRAYINMMIDDHKDDLEQFEEIAKKAENKQVQVFALRTYPVLKAHLDSAIAIRKR
ncbi:MAG: hypothetical protein JWP88_707 [Flaviaesturariibacter sp.]|nr:hypothetical protein [Flaviaesturariibacter sp.]